MCLVERLALATASVYAWKLPHREKEGHTQCELPAKTTAEPSPLLVLFFVWDCLSVSGFVVKTRHAIKDRVFRSQQQAASH